MDSVRREGGLGLRELPSLWHRDWKRAYAILIDPSLDTGGLVNVGDWVSVTNVLVEEYRGTTMLQYAPENSAGSIRGH